MRDTGNNHAQREVYGVDLVNLAFFRLVCPKAYLSKVWIYISNCNPTIRPYYWYQIVRVEQHLSLWQKKRSATSNEAYCPNNLRKRDYWEEPFPSGVNNQDTALVIDIDKTRFKIDDQDRKRGKVTKQRCANSKGNYEKGDRNMSLLMRISGNQQDLCEFHQIASEGGNP